MNEKEYLDNCISAKVILMLCIVMGHCIGPYASQTWFTAIDMPKVQLLAVLSRFLNSFHIYAFTLISGYIYYFSKFEIGKYKNYALFIRNKVLRLVVPYIALSLFWAIPFRIVFFDTTCVQLIDKFVLGDSPEQLWFLLMLFFVFVIYDPLAKYIDRYFPCATAIIIGAYFVGTIWDFTPDYLQFFNALRFLIFFHTGCGLRKYRTLFELLRKAPTIVHLFLFMIVFLINEYLLMGQRRELTFKLAALLFGFLSNLLGSVSCFVCIQKINMTNNDVIKFFRDKTMTIYLLHQQLVYVVTYSLGLLTRSAFVVVPICFVAVVSVSIAIGNLLSRHRSTRLCLGM